MFANHRKAWPVIVMALTLGGVGFPIAAQAPGPLGGGSDVTDDPPARVGRLSYLQGPVSLQPAGADDWAAAQPNRPVTTGDRVWSDSTGRVEVDAGSAVLRLSTFTELELVRLDDHWLQVRLPQGTLNERVKVLSGDQDNEIDVPNAAIALLNSGEYRVDVSGDGRATTVTVWSGSAEVTAAGSSFRVESGQTATIRGDSTLSYDLANAGAPDEFDRWSKTRDDREDAATTSRRYVSEYMPGDEDLDSYGRWEVDQSYGPIWYPTAVEAGWAPYRFGHWVWISPWGWTWVDSEPWGFAPFHYGRWAFVAGRWGWCPGRVIAEPVYAPALVVFVGGPGLSVSAAFGGGGGVAWFPLAPGEVYYPAYATDLGYRRRINITNVTNVTNITNVTNVNVTNITYRNRVVAGAVTAVPQRVFVGSQPVRQSVVTLAPADLNRARVVGMEAPVAPTPASLATFGPGRRVVPPPALASRPVAATHAPPPRPVPFSVQQRALAANGGRPLTPEQVSSLRPAQPTQRTAQPFHSAEAPAPSGRGLVRAGTPTQPKAPVAQAAPRPAQPQRAPAPAAEPARPQPAPERAEQAAPPAARPARPQPAPPQQAAQRPSSPAVPHPPASLERSYQAERNSVETRHRQEYAHPPAGETPAALSQRQDSEDRNLERRYQQARAQNMPTMPPKAEKPAQPQQAQPPQGQPERGQQRGKEQGQEKKRPPDK